MKLSKGKKVLLTAVLLGVGYVAYLYLVQYIAYVEMKKLYPLLETKDARKVNISFNCQDWINKDSSFSEFYQSQAGAQDGNFAMRTEYEAGAFVDALQDRSTPETAFFKSRNAEVSVLRAQKNHLYMATPTTLSMHSIKSDPESLSQKGMAGLLVLLGKYTKPTWTVFLNKDAPALLFMDDDIVFTCTQERCFFIDAQGKRFTKEESDAQTQEQVKAIIQKLPTDHPLFASPTVCNDLENDTQIEGYLANPKLLNFCQPPGLKQPLRESARSSVTNAKNICAQFKAEVLPTMQTYLAK